MKTYKLTVEALEGRDLPSGVWTPPDHNVPPPTGGQQQTLVRPPSQPGHVGDIFHNPFRGISLTPGSKSEIFAQKSSDVSIPPMWQADWKPVTSIFSGQPGRATGGGSAISIEFTSAGVVDPTNRDTVYLCGRAETGQPVSVPDGGTVLLGGANGMGLFGDGSVRGITLVEVLAAAKTETVDNNETITIHG